MGRGLGIPVLGLGGQVLGPGGLVLGIKWHQSVRNDEARRITKQPNLAAIFQSRRLSIFWAFCTRG